MVYSAPSGRDTAIDVLVQSKCASEKPLKSHFLDGKYIGELGDGGDYLGAAELRVGAH